MSDLVERARAAVSYLSMTGKTDCDPSEVLTELADEIERLRAALDEYGHHTPTCPFSDGENRCTCGWEEFEEATDE